MKEMTLDEWKKQCVLLPISTASGAPPGACFSGVDWSCQGKGIGLYFVNLKNKRDDHHGYWLALSRSAAAASDPLVVWLSGGPGSPTLAEILSGDGPCVVEPDFSRRRNPYTWNSHAHVVFLNEPPGVDDANSDVRDEEIGRDMYAFLDGFMDIHPEFVGRPLYLTGESYAGHYITEASNYIWTKNKQLASSAVKRVDLQGVAIGDGDPNLVFQYKNAEEIAINDNYNLTLPINTQFARMKADSEDCARLMTIWAEFITSQCFSDRRDKA